jgi:hypothetical protein
LPRACVGSNSIPPPLRGYPAFALVFAHLLLVETPLNINTPYSCKEPHHTLAQTTPYCCTHTHSARPPKRTLAQKLGPLPEKNSRTHTLGSPSEKNDVSCHSTKIMRFRATARNELGGLSHCLYHHRDRLLATQMSLIRETNGEVSLVVSLMRQHSSHTSEGHTLLPHAKSNPSYTRRHDFVPTLTHGPPPGSSGGGGRATPCPPRSRGRL